MTVGDMLRVFGLSEGVQQYARRDLIEQAIQDAGNLKGVLNRHRFRVQESSERVSLNGLLSRGYAPRTIEAYGPREAFAMYAKEIANAMGNWYELRQATETYEALQA